MITVWRLCRSRHAQAPLSGEGARLHGGRWNDKGTRLVYCAESLSLACLEALVHLDLKLLPEDMQALGIEIPAEVTRRSLAVQDLPADWDQVPGPEPLKALGSAWAAAREEALLIVPSAVIPGEVNILINPEHPDAARLRVLPPHPFRFDGRLQLS